MKSDGTVEGQIEKMVKYTVEEPVRMNGVQVGTKTREVCGGHAKHEGSVWRVALSPKKYHEKFLAHKAREELHGSRLPSPCPQLDDDEMAEYKEYVAFLEAKGVDIAEDAEFYASKSEPKKKAGRPAKEDTSTDA